MTNWNDETAFQKWQHLITYYGDVLNFVFYYKLEEHLKGHIRVRFIDEASDLEAVSDDEFRTIEEAREYVEQYKEKLMKLIDYEKQLDFSISYN